MQIRNQTEWQTRNLKTFVSRVCQQELLDSKFVKRLVVTFEYKKSCGSKDDDKYPHGYAWYKSTCAVIRLVKGVLPDKQALAKVIAHELAHCQGVHHKDMHGPRYGYAKGWREFYLWAKELPLERYAEGTTIQVTPLTKAQAKLASAQTLLKQWETKKKLASTKVLKYKEKVKYYQSRISELSCK